MTSQAQQLEMVLELLQQVDIDGLHMVERTVQRLLQQRTTAQTGREQEPSTLEDFHQRYRMTIDADLWALVGSQPATPVEEDKTLIRAQIRQRLSA
jgi:hypothetical protein